jgi:mono/diheme cytochrome c family protein
MYKKLFIGGNIVLFILLILAMAQDLFRPWMPYQRQYRKMQIEQATTPEAKAMINRRPTEIKQLLLPSFKEVDRCITCHQGMDPLATPTLANDFKENPFKSHPGDFLKNHPPEKFGCVMCHSGQGLATTFVGAGHSPRDAAQKDDWRKKHDWEPAHHWESPMLTAPFIQAACVRCHGDFESVPGMEAAVKGKQLLTSHGCLGCHQWKGEGGPISVDLAEETANKPLSRIDFSHTGLEKEDQTLLNWIRLHFVDDTWKLVPGDPQAHFNKEPIAPSGMPDFREELSAEDADALATYILSGKSGSIPHTVYRPGPKQPTFEEMKFTSHIQAGKWSFDRHGCAGCHGLGGKGGRRNFNYTGGFEPALVKTVPNYTRDELRKKIREGVQVVGKEDPKGATPPLYMPAWKDKIKGAELEALLDYLFSIGEKQEDWGG